MKNKQRYLVDADGADATAMNAAIRIASFAANEQNVPVSILVDSLFSSFHPGENSSLTEILPSNVINDLNSTTVANFDGTEIRAFETDNIDSDVILRVSLAAYTSPQTLDLLEFRDDVEVIVAVPFLRSDCNEWERQYNPRLVALEDEDGVNVG